MEKIIDTEILQVHYYLSNNSHSMDAKILNKVERELLKIVEEVSSILDLELVSPEIFVHLSDFQVQG